MNIRYRMKKYALALAVVTIFGILYFKASPPGTPWIGKESHLLNLSLGAFGGFFVLLVQFFIDDSRDKELEHLQSQKIVRVHQTRDDKDYYAKLIEKSKTEISVYGVTANRFVNDFSDETSPRAEKKLVQEAMARGVKVRIAIAAEQYLSVDDKLKATAVRQKFLLLQSQYKEKFQVRVYQHPPTFALTVVDNNCLFGPVFPNTRSQDSATIHALKGGYIADSYLSQFECEWSAATPLA